MNEQETIVDIIAWLRRPREGENAYLTAWRDEIADRLEAALKRERGDAAKLREALKTVKRYLDGYTVNILELRRTVDAALVEPPRNCDVYTADELKTIFKSELVSQLPIANEHEKNLVTITATGVIDTLLAPATEKKGGKDADNTNTNDRTTSSDL